MEFKKTVNDYLVEDERVTGVFQKNEGKEKTTKKGNPYWQWFLDDVKGSNGGTMLCAWNPESNEKLLSAFGPGKKVTLEYVDRYAFNIVDTMAEEYFDAAPQTKDVEIKTDTKTETKKEVPEDGYIDMSKPRGFAIAYAKDLAVAKIIKLKDMLETAEAMADYIAHGIQRDIETEGDLVDVGYNATKAESETLLATLRGLTECRMDDKPNSMLAKGWIVNKMNTFYNDTEGWDADHTDLVSEIQQLDAAFIEWCQAEAEKG